IGLSAILRDSAEAFTAVKIIGSVFLLYQAFVLVRSKPETLAIQLERPLDSGRRVFWQAFLTNVLNPKVAIFFLAFLPQFVRVDAPNKAVAMGFLGLVFTTNGTL